MNSYSRKAADRALTVLTILTLMATALVAARHRLQGLGSTPAAASRPLIGTDSIALVYLSSTCRACTRQPEAGGLADALRRFAHVTPRPRLVGISVDLDAAAGADYLHEVAPFDEISAGGGWNNELSIRYLFPDNLPAMANVPQLVLVERKLTMTEGRPALSEIEVTVVQRVMGLRPITDWVSRQVNLRQPSSE